MRRVMLDSYLKQAIKENVDKLDIMDDIEVPVIHDVWNEFENNLEYRYGDIKNKKSKTKNILFFSKRVCIVIACIMVFSSMLSFIYEIPTVKAFRSSLINTIIEKAGGIFTIRRTSEKEIDERDNSEIDYMDGGESISLTFADINEAKEEIAFHLFVPEYLPSSYTFNEITLDIYSTGKERVTQLYSNKENEIITIEQYTNMSDIDEVISVDGEDTDAKVVIINDLEVVIVNISPDNMNASWVKDGYSLEIYGTIEEAELVYIIECLE